MAEVIYEGHACVDCTMMIANNDETGIQDYDDWRRRVHATALSDLGHVVMACPEDCEGSFSWSSCDYCGSTLGGERHPIAVLA